jgi:hypothetical protein
MQLNRRFGFKALGLAAAASFILAATASADSDLPKLRITIVGGNVMNVAQPCPPTRSTLLRFQNASAAAITVDWDSLFLQHDLTCVGDYVPKSGTVTIPANSHIFQPITLSFIGDCLGEADIQFNGSIPAEPADTDSATLEVNCTGAPAVPASSTWSLIALGVVLMGSVAAMLRRSGII